MFSRGMNVVLEYRAIPVITNDSLLKRTMGVIDLKFADMSEPEKRMMVFKL